MRHLVVVLPGIGGSVLHRPGGGPRWDQRRRSMAAAALDPGRLNLTEHPTLDPVGLLPGIRLAGPFVLPGYDRLVHRIERAFRDVRVDTARPGQPPDLRADLLLFPYDFRLGVQDAAERLAAELTARLAGETPGARRRRVIVLAHSMGGLVARYWLGPLGGAADCAALVTLGTPHRGAPKALELLVNGARVGLARFDAVTEVLRDWPAVYQLLPRYPVVAAGPGGAERYPYELAEGVPEGFTARAKAAFAVHRDIEDAWGELAGSAEFPEVTPVFGRGHATLQQAVSVGAGFAVGKEAPAWLPNPDWHGDGTVPAVSAIPIELGEQPSKWRATSGRHLELSSAAAAVELLQNWSAGSLRAVRGDTPDRPWLGLDLDEAVPAGAPVEVGVTLHGAEADERTAVRVRVRPEGDADGANWIAGVRSGAVQWAATLPPLRPGAYHLTVEAVQVPEVDQLRCDEVFGVVGAGAR
ncbi:triacylglycerol lipase [Kitasatospora sp. MMS16-BH015]|uniref:esterase/lipase family protein n=1 Tax=Kitasatospora sp. MMS16-BH015 TaxID=2018025 RepID=UPI000CF1E450|nr:hypothetical protein [Kitasatospora sp. MMS16-BH015]